MGASPSAWAEPEPNDTIAAATPIGVGVDGITDASIFASGDKDFYRFEAPAAGTYTIDIYDVASAMGRMCVQPYRSDQTAFNLGCGGGNGRSNVLRTVEVSLSGTYWFSVSTWESSRSGTYKVRVLPSYSQGLTWDTLGEPNGKLSLAESITVGSTTGRTRAIDPVPATVAKYEDDVDFYRFEAPAAGTYTIDIYDVASAMGRMCVQPYRSDQTAFNLGCGGGNGRSNVLRTVEVSLSGTYWFSVSTWESSRSGTYKVRVLPSYSQGLTWDTLGEPDGTWDLARSLVLAENRESAIDAVPSTVAKYNDDIDWYRFSTSSGSTYSVTTAALAPSVAADPTLTVFDSSGDQIAASYSCSTSAGTCNSVSFTSSLGGTYFAAFSAGSEASGTYTICATRSGTPCATRYDGYQPLTPARILDTRTGLGAPKAVLSPGQSLTLQVSGRGGVPATGASAVVLNVTAVSPSASGYVSVFPTGSAAASVSNLNFPAGVTIANQAMVKLGTGGKVTLTSSARTNVLVDVGGFYPTTGGKFTPLTPTRIVDTRSGLGAPQSKVAAGGTLAVQVLGRGGVPSSGVGSVALNVTTIAPTTGGYATVWPSGVPMPTTSSTNFRPRTTVAAFVLVKVGSDGRVLYSPSTSADVAVDVAGWFPTGSDFVGTTPTRILDTRSGVGATVGAVPGGSVVTFKVLGVGGVPSTGVKAVSLNVTAAGPTTGGWLTTYPSGVTQPSTSTVNYLSGGATSNSILVKVGADGRVALYTSATSNLIADISGYVKTS
ncbi:hypothetical protein ACOCJ5_17695 [Knoellia sp. CPCC 206450]|uniref:hypothetical protein n=1 Tax=Knoellia tibetensis TaxID=3404798 RepID=UPI003B42EE59